MVLADRVQRTLSAFNASTRRWASVPMHSAHGSWTKGLNQIQNSAPVSPTRLSLVSWNIDAFSPRPIARAKLILAHILSAPKPPDVFFLQEVTRDVRTALLDDVRVRAAFLTTDAQDLKSFYDVPFATMTLLAKERFAHHSVSQMQEDTETMDFMLGQVARLVLPSKYRRDGLCVDIVPPAAPDTAIRLINVHLDSLWDTLNYRVGQMKILSNVLREPGCNAGLIAGDLNAIRPEDHGLIERNGLVDAWTALHGTSHSHGATWSVGAKRRDGLEAKRMDKIAMRGLTAEKMEVLRPGLIELPKPGGESVEISWSDHCGLKCNIVF
jgi:tyrosyl-DNA phosphodiesterase 2